MVINTPASSFYLVDKQRYLMLYDQVLPIPFAAVLAVAGGGAAVVLVAAVLSVHAEPLQVNVHLWNFSAQLGFQHHQCSLSSVCYHYFDSSVAVGKELSKHHHLQMKQSSSHDDDVHGCQIKLN
jgi:hypothetical protein